MIVLDATVLIALLNSRDAHAQAALDLLQVHGGDALGVSPINLAEALVGPARHGRLEVAMAVFEGAAIGEVVLPPDAASRLANLRAETRCKMPDCCALLAAQDVAGRLATFDDQLAAAAQRLGIEVVGI